MIAIIPFFNLSNGHPIREFHSHSNRELAANPVGEIPGKSRTLD